MATWKRPAVRRDRRRRPAAETGLASWPQPEPVNAWMKTAVATVNPGTDIAAAARLMKARRVRHLPVVDGRERLIGIVTDRDLRQVVFDQSIQERVGERGEALQALAVREVMTWGVITVRPDSDLREAARLMREQRIGALPVVSRGKLVGLLTETDLLGALEEVLRGRVKRPLPLPAAGRRVEYHFGFPAPAWESLWRDGEVVG